MSAEVVTFSGSLKDFDDQFHTKLRAESDQKVSDVKVRDIFEKYQAEKDKFFEGVFDQIRDEKGEFSEEVCKLKFSEKANLYRESVKENTSKHPDYKDITKEVLEKYHEISRLNDEKRTLRQKIEHHAQSYSDFKIIALVTAFTVILSVIFAYLAWKESSEIKKLEESVSEKERDLSKAQKDYTDKKAIKLSLELSPTFIKDAKKNFVIEDAKKAFVIESLLRSIHRDVARAQKIRVIDGDQEFVIERPEGLPEKDLSEMSFKEKNQAFGLDLLIEKIEDLPFETQYQIYKNLEQEFYSQALVVCQTNYLEKGVMLQHNKDQEQKITLDLRKKTISGDFMFFCLEFSDDGGFEPVTKGLKTVQTFNFDTLTLDIQGTEESLVSDET